MTLLWEGARKKAARLSKRRAWLCWACRIDCAVSKGLAGSLAVLSCGLTTVLAAAALHSTVHDASSMPLHARQQRTERAFREHEKYGLLARKWSSFLRGALPRTPLKVTFHCTSYFRCTFWEHD